MTDRFSAQSDTPGVSASAWRPVLSWPDSAVWGVCLIVLYAVVAALPILLALVLQVSLGQSLLTQAGKGAALVGFALLALQTALSARLRLFERPFGLDRVMIFHKTMALTAATLLLLHPILLGLGRSGFWSRALLSSWMINVGLTALALLWLGVLFALFFGALGVQYQLWRFLHKGMVIIIALGFVHAIFIGSAFRMSPVMQVLWWALFLGACGLWLYRNPFVPLAGRRRYRVESVAAETHNTFTLTLSQQGGRPLVHHPGQFMFLKLRRPLRPSEQHPFTISSLPTREGPITVTIKQSGDFTNTIDRTVPGDEALVEAPYGRFSYAYCRAKSFVFIAGGVGITPIMSMLRCLRDTGDARQAVLIYANRAERDIVFREELSHLGESVKVVHVLSEAEAGWQGLRGWVTEQIISESTGDRLGDADVFLCGPPAMMKAVVRTLRSLRVPSRRIHYERFSL